MARVALFLASAWLASGAAELGAGTRALLGHKDHSYKPHELVALYANKAGPFHNPRRDTSAAQLLPTNRGVGTARSDTISRQTHVVALPLGTLPPRLTCALTCATGHPGLTTARFPSSHAHAQRNVPVL